MLFEFKWPETEVILAPDGRTGIEKEQSEKPDIVLLDLGLPDLDGIEVCKTIRAASKVPIVILTARDSDEDVVTGLNSGADDYITKPFKHVMFLARINAIARRGRADDHPASRFECGELIMDFESHDVIVSGREIQLRGEEYKLLERLVTSRSGLVTDSELLELVWGREYSDATEYLDTYMNSLKEKMGSGKEAGGAIIRELNVGYRYEPTIAS